jgi:hypothetical protein
MDNFASPGKGADESQEIIPETIAKPKRHEKKKKNDHTDLEEELRNLESVVEETNEFPWIHSNARVSIYWDGEDKWFAATVTRPSTSEPGRWWIKYEDANPSVALETPSLDTWKPL